MQSRTSTANAGSRTGIIAEVPFESGPLTLQDIGGTIVSRVGNFDTPTVG